MAETLMPCPFCGGVAGVDKTNYYFEDTGEHAMSAFVVSCRSCGMKTAQYRTEDSAIKRWNRRAERTCHVATKECRFSRTQTLVTKSCSACGCAFGSEEVRPILPGLDETMVLDPVDVPSYCPHCGARVEGA